jgi:predicted hotdog family 3-hydroxylacyl-ACP dehydratase
MNDSSYPVSTQELLNWLPHRTPAVWIDEVSWIRPAEDEVEGECRVCFQPDANYADANGQPRDSSFIEWIAQSYGFVRACHMLSALIKINKKPEKTFLAQIRDFELIGDHDSTRMTAGDWLRIHVKRTHQIGPLALVVGTVISPRGDILAQAKLKLYAA